MTSFTRYLLFQIPGWVIAAAALFGVVGWAGLSIWIGAGLFLLWVIKDFALYPFFRKSCQVNVPTGSERLIGEIGTTKEWLGPEGYVRIRGELWRAVADPQDQPISPETSVLVKAADGLTLTVSTENGSGNAQKIRVQPMQSHDRSESS